MLVAGLESRGLFRRGAYQPQHEIAAQKAAIAANVSSVWLTVAEAAQYLKIRVRTLLLWARQGKVKGYVLSGT